MIPVIVDRRQLLAANSLYVFTLQGAFFVGFALLGPLVVNVSGQTITLIVVAALFVIAAGLCLAVAALPAGSARAAQRRSRRRSIG